MSPKQRNDSEAPHKPAAPAGPTEWLLEATRQLPATKFALGVVAVVAVAAISVGFFLGNWVPALYGGVAAFIGMILMRIYAVSKPKTARIDVSLPVQVLVWTGVVAFVAVTALGLIRLGMLTFQSESDADPPAPDITPVETPTELSGEQCNLLELGALASHLQNYRSSASTNVQLRVGDWADSMNGNLFLSEPIETDVADPVVDVEVREDNGRPPAIAGVSSFVEIHLIPRAGSHGYSSGTLYLENGNARHQFTGTVPAGSTVVVAYVFDGALNLPEHRRIRVLLR